jgi:hypothetical protein
MSPPGQGLQESPQPRPTDPLNVSQTTGGLCLVPCLYQNLRKSLALAYNLSFFRSLFFSVQAVALFVPQRQETPLLPYALYLRRLYDILNVNIFR